MVVAARKAGAQTQDEWGRGGGDVAVSGTQPAWNTTPLLWPGLTEVTHGQLRIGGADELAAQHRWNRPFRPAC